MNLKKERNIIKIPNNILVLYCKKKNILIIKGPLLQKLISLKLKIFINKDKKLIKISKVPIMNISNKERKKIKSLRGTTKALIKHKLIEASIIIYKKLELHGVGYRILLDDIRSKDKLLTFKLGYSHLVFFKIPLKLNIFCFSKTKLSIFGNSYQDVNQISAKIRAKKKPEPYKGKGILYENETIILKEGKKI